MFSKWSSDIKRRLEDRIYVIEATERGVQEIQGVR